MFAAKELRQRSLGKAHSLGQKFGWLQLVPMQARRILFFANMRLGSGHRTLEALGFGIDPSTLT